MDSDVYKWLEAAAWEYGREPAEELLGWTARGDRRGRRRAGRRRLPRLRRAGRAKGRGRYSTCPGATSTTAPATCSRPPSRRSAAPATPQLLDVAVKLADHLVATFGETADGKIRDVDGHPVVEMGLVELYRETGTRGVPGPRALVRRGARHGHHRALTASEPTYFSDRVPVREADDRRGPRRARGLPRRRRGRRRGRDRRRRAARRARAAVRAHVGHEDLRDRRPRRALGGRGVRRPATSCRRTARTPRPARRSAACSGRWRMLLATGDARYADLSSGCSTTAFLPASRWAGTEYFYVNALQLRDGAHAEEDRSPAHGRRGWFDCACCPPNIMRTLSSLDGYLATTYRRHGRAAPPVRRPARSRPPGVDAVGSRPTTPGTAPSASTVTAPPGRQVALALRVPAWAEGATARTASPADAGGEYAARRRDLVGRRHRRAATCR